MPLATAVTAVADLMLTQLAAQVHLHREMLAVTLALALLAVVVVVLMHP
jgi:hypothetical protein